MNYLVSYDMSNNKNRKKISDYLLEKGFLRIQKSVFLGEIVKTKIEDILENICLFLDKEEASLVCIPIDKDNYEKIYNYGKNENYNIYKEDILYL